MTLRKVTCLWFLVVGSEALVQFSRSASTGKSGFATLRAQSSGRADTSATGVDSVVAEEEKNFKIVTCMSTSCSQKRKSLGLDSLSTFGGMYSRAASTSVQVEEGPCLGSCKKAPCIAIEHEDFVGSVSLEGMTDDEFSSKA